VLIKNALTYQVAL